MARGALCWGRSSCARRLERRPATRPRISVEGLEERTLMAGHSPWLPNVGLVVSPGPHAAGQVVVLHAVVLPGLAAELPRQFEFQERTSRNGPWEDVAPPSSSTSVTSILSRSGFHQYRVLATILVDADAALDADEPPEGFQDVIDLSMFPNGYALGSSAPFAAADLLLTFTAQARAFLAAPEGTPPAPAPMISDTLKITTNVKIHGKDANGKDAVIKPKNPVIYEESLNENQPEGDAKGQQLITQPGFTINRYSVIVFMRVPVLDKDDKPVLDKNGKPVTKEVGKVVSAMPNVDSAVCLINDHKISDIIVLHVGGGFAVDSFEFTFYSAGKTPLKITTDNSKPGVLVPENTAFVDETPGKMQDITRELFPKYYGKNGKVLSTIFGPPFKVEVLSNEEPAKK